MSSPTDHIFDHKLNKRERLVALACILLVIPALLINLGYMAVIEDEAIRGLVSLEMWYSGDYIAPTINTEPYYNKPPLYNWIILLSYTLFGSASEFSLRFPTALFTMIYSVLVYHLYYKDMGKLAALTIALLTLTCGRIFFYDSFLGLIDMCFSMCMFSLMIGTYQLARQQKWTKMFVFAYALGAVGFLLKTLPAIVFLGISLLVILVAEKSFRKLFSLSHFIGIGTFTLLVGSYYFVYSLDHDIVALFTRMLTESSDRTVVKFGIWKTVQHLFTFPIEVFYHFLPWTILVIYLFRKSSFKKLWNHPFLRMNLILLMANIILYWTSPQVYGRYLLMFPPLIFAPLYYLHQQNQKDNSIHFKIVKWVLIGLVAFICISVFSLPFIARLSFVPGLYLKAGSCALLCIAAIYLFWSSEKFRLLYVFLFMIIFRIAFNWFVFPDRNNNDYSNEVRQSAIEAAQKYGASGLSAEKNILFRSTSYYITRESKKLLPAVEAPFEGLLITFQDKENCKKVGHIKSRDRSNDYLVLECKQ